MAYFLWFLFCRRPDSSFLWFMSPLKTLKYIFWKNWKWMILKIAIFALFVILIILFFYSFPGAAVDKMFGNWCPPIALIFLYNIPLSLLKNLAVKFTYHSYYEKSSPFNMCTPKIARTLWMWYLWERLYKCWAPRKKLIYKWLRRHSW